MESFIVVSKSAQLSHYATLLSAKAALFFKIPPI